ncbi:Uncharacterised protein [Bordetella pertussis]|nr:Uncharacterised protein [Bordetella pertussis]
MVGTCTKRIPRMYTAAAKPVMSPITPPPSATSTARRSRRFSSRASKIRFRVCQSLCASPSGNSMRSTRLPVRARAASTRAPYRPATVGLVTTAMAVASAGIDASSASRRPGPIWMG